MHPRRILPLLLLVAGLAPAPASAHVETFEHDGVTIVADHEAIVVSTGPLVRTFAATGLGTRSIEAFGVERLATPVSDVDLGALGVHARGDDAFLEASFEVTEVPGGLALTRRVTTSAGLSIERRDEFVAGIAGSRAQTHVTLAGVLPVEEYVLETLAAGPGARATVHAFRAGADWRYNEDFDPYGIGDDHRGHWRASTSGGVGQDLAAFGEWLEVTYPDGGTAALVMERNAYASSRGEFVGASGTARSLVDLSRDIAYTGPFEEQIHVESPEQTSEVGRVRVIGPGAWSMEPVYAVFGRDTDETAAAFNALLARRNRGFDRRVIFNTNNVDQNRISTGAKDDVDFATFVELARRARAAGMTTFVLDDGWQAISGDWCPDSPECPEPRKAQNPVKYAARFPDHEFRAVQQILRDDPETPEDDRDLELGLWMTPMEFHPASAAFETNPQWACLPVGAGTAGLSIVQPDSSSNEAGLGVWNPLAMGVNPEDPTQPMRLDQWIESRIDRMVEVYGASYFKFDFLAFIDCGGVYPVDQYQYREAFIAMVDRLIAKHPHVLFTIDETNDYRMFPYESTSRGATWFQNGSPNLAQTLHNIWNLSPYVPGYTLGQGVASRGDELGSLGVDPLMAAGLTSHITVWRDLRAYTPAQLERMRIWNEFYRDHRATLATMTYPLLEDPLEGGWTALQPWDHANANGWVLAYRQGDARGSISIPVKALGQVAGDEEFAVVQHDPATGSASMVTMSASQLRAGALTATTGPNGYALFEIYPASWIPQPA